MEKGCLAIKIHHISYEVLISSWLLFCISQWHQVSFWKPSTKVRTISVNSNPQGWCTRRGNLKKKIIGGGGRWGGWDGLLDFFFENVLWILLNWGMNWQKKIYFLICTLREYVPSEYFPASSENPCPTTLYLWEDWNVLNNVYFLKFWSSFAGGSQGFC